jgi:hypothetical protein
VYTSDYLNLVDFSKPHSSNILALVHTAAVSIACVNCSCMGINVCVRVTIDARRQRLALAAMPSVIVQLNATSMQSTHVL